MTDPSSARVGRALAATRTVVPSRRTRRVSTLPFPALVVTERQDPSVASRSSGWMKSEIGRPTMSAGSHPRSASADGEIHVTTPSGSAR